jgi:hypothetical protein
MTVCAVHGQMLQLVAKADRYPQQRTLGLLTEGGACRAAVPAQVKTVCADWLRLRRPRTSPCCRSRS